MRRILTEFYSWMYNLTGSKLFSYISGLVYLTVMNYIIVDGMSMLMRDLFPIVSMISLLFAFPYFIFTGVLLFGLSYWLTPPVQAIAKDAKKTHSHRTLLLYTAFALVLFLYKHFGDWLFV